MSFVTKINSPDSEKTKDSKQNVLALRQKKIPFYKKKGWKIFFFVIFLFLIVIISYSAYIVSSGSKVFEKGITPSSIKKILTGQKEVLKGEETGRVNILLEGMGGIGHPGGMLTDSIIILSIDTTNKKAAMVSIPRDLQVNIAGFGESKINAAYADGYTDYMSKKCGKKNQSGCMAEAMQSGANLSIDTLSSTLSIPINYYITADFEGFEKIIDEVGGVDVYVDKTLNDPLFPADDMIHYSPFKITAGTHHLDGKTALKYARSRETTSDFDRASRQQKIIKAFEVQAESVGVLANPKKIADLTSILGDSIKTNFTASELRTFIDLVKSIPQDQIINKVLSNGPGGLLVDYNNGTYYLKPKTGNFKEVQKLFANIFSQVQSEDARVEITNSSGVTGLGTTLSKTLKDDLGFEITSVLTKKDTSAKTVIIDYTSGNKPIALKNLQNQLNITNVTSKSTSNQNADFSIVIGADFDQTALKK